MIPSDAELLRQFAARGQASQAAFATLVERHLDLVYSVARRHVRSAHLAEEVAQSVFVDLARHAQKIPADTPLVAWLHLVSRRSAIDAVRREARRRKRERAAAADLHVMSHSSPGWEPIEPLLDEAVESLPAADRTAILLRFFENKSLRDVGAALGISDDAAQKRVSRALDELRSFLVRRGVSIHAATLTTALSAHAIQAAPAGLGASVVAAQAALLRTAAMGSTHALPLTAMQKTALLATAVALGGAGLYEAAVLRAQSAVLSASGQQTDALRTRISAIRADHADIARKLADTEAQIDVRLSDAGVDAPSRDKALEAQARQWLAQVQRLRDFFVQRPDVIIPELQLLKENDWFTIATSSPLRTEADLRRASSRLRGRAEEHAASVLQQALRAFIAARDGQLPTYPQELAPFCPVPLAPTIFERYEMLATGKAADLARRTEEQNLPPFFAPVLGVRKPNDVELDMYWTLDASGSSYSRPAFAHNLEEARNRFFKTHGARKAPSMQELQPYLRWPLSLEVLENPLRRDAP